MVSAVVSNGISSGMAQGISNGPSSGIPNSTTYSDSSGDPGRASTASHAFLLSIINARDDAQPARLIPLIEAWIAEWEGTLLTRKRTCQVATADVQVANEKVEAFLADLKGKRGEWLAHHGCDVNVCHLPICERLQRVPGEFLFIFDLDSTLIQMECVDELARIAGKYEAVAALTREAMEGGMGFREAFAQRISLLRGLNAEASYQALVKRIVFTPGVHDLAKRLRTVGVHTAIVSGGFMPIAEHVKASLGFDHCFANSLAAADGLLTGDFEGDLVDGDKKLEILKGLREKLGIPPENVIAVGDGANDVPMLLEAGIGVAFCAKPIVREKVSTHLNQPNLSHLRDLIGLD